jgi:hypothetical protein
MTMSYHEATPGALDVRGPEPNDERTQSALEAAAEADEFRRALLVYGTAGSAARLGIEE